jgi:type IV secretion system protein VirB4
MISNLKIPKLKNHNIGKREISISRFIPYKCHWNHNTILTKNDELIRVIKVQGFSFETADDEEIDTRKNTRNNFLKGMADGKFSLYFHTIRRAQKAFPDGDIHNMFAKNLNDKWRDKNSSNISFVNEHYITIIRGKEKGVVGGIQSIINRFKDVNAKVRWEKEMQEAYAELEEVSVRVATGMSSYGSEILGLAERTEGIFSEILEFLCRIVNCNYSQPIAPPSMSIADHIGISKLFFYKNYIESHHIDSVKYAAVISLKEYRPSTHGGMMDGFMRLPYELIITQSFSFIDKMFAISSMQLQQRRLTQSEDVAKSQIYEIDRALDDAMSGRIAFGNHHLSILIIENSLDELEKAASQCIVTLSNTGIMGVREKINMEPAYWGQLPGNGNFVVRKSVINTLNIASFASFHNYPSGKRTGNHWGNAVTVFNTASGTPFFFNFHVRDVGHTMVIGPTGAGKTVLLNFLCAQAQKFNCRLFFFDKDHGAEIFIRAIEGIYMKPQRSSPSGFNPLQLKDNSDNRSFLVEWFCALIDPKNNGLLPEEMDKINEAIKGNYNLKKEDRTLKNIVPFLGISGPGTLSSKVEMWHSGGSHASLFDNAKDNINFSLGNNFGIEMGEILDDSRSLSPVLLYLFHRINSSLDGTPTMIVLDEAWALIDNKVFAPKIKNWLKVLRKLNTFVVFATQSVEDASKSDISDTLVQQTATQIFLPNLRATSAYRDVFMLSEREMILVKNTDPSSRFFLLKQDNQGVIARINLSGMDNEIAVLSGRVETVEILNDIIAEVGDDPEDWLDIFYRRVNG